MLRASVVILAFRQKNDRDMRSVWYNLFNPCLGCYVQSRNTVNTGIGRPPSCPGIPRLDVQTRNMQLDTYHVIKKLEVLLYIENFLQINNAFCYIC